MSERLSGGQLLVEALIEHGVPRLFCVPGESFLAVLDALYDVPEHRPLITCRHESGAAFMAAATANRPDCRACVSSRAGRARPMPR